MLPKLVVLQNPLKTFQVYLCSSLTSELLNSNLWVGHRRFLNVLKMILVHRMPHGILCHVSQDIKKPQKDDDEVQSLKTHFLNRFPVSSCNASVTCHRLVGSGLWWWWREWCRPEQGRDWECYNGKRCALKRFFCAYIKLYQTYSLWFGFRPLYHLLLSSQQTWRGNKISYGTHMTPAPIAAESDPNPSKSCWLGLEKTVIPGPEPSVRAGSDQKAGWIEAGMAGCEWHGSFHKMGCEEVMETK